MANNNNNAADPQNLINMANGHNDDNIAPEGNEEVPNLQELWDNIQLFIQDMGVALVNMQGAVHFPPIPAGDPHMLQGEDVEMDEDLGENDINELMANWDAHVAAQAHLPSDSVDECPICMEILCENPDCTQDCQVYRLPCSHRFHYRCIYEGGWITVSDTCPSCRAWLFPNPHNL